MTLIRRGRRKNAVGYIRVSTETQASDGFGLEQQTDLIHAFAEQNGFVLQWVYEDVATGNDRRLMMHRPGFHDAVRQAQRDHAVILVARLDRVSRNNKAFIDLCRTKKVRIVSTVPGETEDFQKMVSAVSKAENVRRNIVQGTKASLTKMKAQGNALGNPATVLKANRASAKSRATASQMTVLEIRDYLLRHVDLRNKSVAEIAAVLNANGIRSGRGLPWTKHSLRRQLRFARQELELLEEPDEDESS